MTNMWNFEVAPAPFATDFGEPKYYCCIPNVTNKPIAKNGPNEIDV
jgi:hypothetical protein